MQTTQTHQEMECPICYDDINAQTGVVTTSCGHSYHFSCISHWYTKQEVASCPCCRKEPGEKEKLPEIQYEDEENSDDEEEEEEEFEEVEFTRAELHAFLQARGGSLSDALALAVCEVVCGLTFTELNFLMLGNCGRALTQDEWNELLQAQDEDEEESDEDEDEDNEGINHNGALSALASVSAGLLTEMNDRNEGADQDNSDESWVSLGSGFQVHSFFSSEGLWLRRMTEYFENEAATKIQSYWRGFNVRQRRLTS